MKVVLKMIFVATFTTRFVGTGKSRYIVIVIVIVILIWARASC